ncbi:MAG: DUF6163 family protein [Hyphomicrobiales bacterium]
MVGGTDRAALTEQETRSKGSIDKVIFGVFLRAIGLLMLGIAVYFWSLVLGVHGEDISKLFDRNNYEAYILVLLSVLTPTVSVGLWLGMSWGVILWGMLGCGLLLSHFFYIPLNVLNYSFASALFVLAVFYCVALLIRYLVKRREQRY